MMVIPYVSSPRAQSLCFRSKRQCSGSGSTAAVARLAGAGGGRRRRSRVRFLGPNNSGATGQAQNGWVLSWKIPWKIPLNIG